MGWHALTVPQQPSELYKAKFETLASLLALGIDPKRSIVFCQDDVRAFLLFYLGLIVLFDFQVSDHLSLSWILTCLTPMGKLKRMTTWKVGFVPKLLVYG